MTIRRRRICYVTGTRADFGLMQATLSEIQRQKDLELSIVVTGTHLSALHGETVNEITAAGLSVSARVEVTLTDSTGAAMARNIGVMLSGFVDAFESLQPDVVLLLGDRGEMIAGALAAIHLNIPVAHIHGGERSGTVDEPIRHAISKLSHIHFTASEDARERLIRMGERPANVFVTGAPGLDNIEDIATVPRATLFTNMEFDFSRRAALFVFHPVLQEAGEAGRHAGSAILALLSQNLQVVALMPNSDVGSELVRRALENFIGHPDVRVVTHLTRPHFISWMAAADVMIGNSSSGIIEAATFGTPVVNIGIRQNLRQRNLNVADVKPELAVIEAAIRTALAGGRFQSRNCYGDGRAGRRIADYLARLPLPPVLLRKCNAY